MDDFENEHARRYFGNYDPVTGMQVGDYTVADIEAEQTFDERFDGILDGLIIGRATSSELLRQSKRELVALVDEMDFALADNDAQDEDLMALRDVARENIDLIKGELIRRIFRSSR